MEPTYLGQVLGVDLLAERRLLLGDDLARLGLDQVGLLQTTNGLHLLTEEDNALGVGLGLVALGDDRDLHSPAVFNVVI